VSAHRFVGIDAPGQHQGTTKGASHARRRPRCFARRRRAGALPVPRRACAGDAAAQPPRAVGALVQALSPEGYEGGGESSEDILRANEEWAEARTAPADSVDAAAFVEARNAASALPVFGGSWILRSGDGGRTFQPVGGTQLQNHLVGRLVFDGQGNVYAATSYGLYKRRAGDLTSSWTLVLRPGVGPFGTTFVNDVVVRPGTHGRGVLANVGWREGTDYNGFYYSGASGEPGTWQKLHVAGIHADDIGRTTFAYSSDGSRLYALVQSPAKLLAPDPKAGNTNLAGVFVSRDGSPSGPYKLIADEAKLAASGSALENQPGYGPGVQAWYNQFVAVDPADARHVYVGLEEVFETTDGGKTFTTPGPYWNFPFPCFATDPASCPQTTHPDQHAVAIGNGRVYVGNDGGIYSRPLRHAQGWTNGNATLRTLQYYYAGLGRTPEGDAVWGGLQDNGESLLLPGAQQMVSPFGGDGGDTLVDPNDGNRAVVEYTNLDMALTTNGGRTTGDPPSFREVSPSCFAFTYTPDPCDPNARFIAPFRADPKAPTTHWVAAGEFVWESTKGFDTTCSGTACDWKIIHDTGAGRATTGLAVVGDVVCRSHSCLRRLQRLLAALDPGWRHRARVRVHRWRRHVDRRQRQPARRARRRPRHRPRQAHARHRHRRVHRARRRRHGHAVVAPGHRTADRRADERPDAEPRRQPRGGRDARARSVERADAVTG